MNLTQLSGNQPYRMSVSGHVFCPCTEGQVSGLVCLMVAALWILKWLLQMLNVVLLLCQIFLRFIPNIWIIFVIILYEGLLGGAAYVNTFFSITTEVRRSPVQQALWKASVRARKWIQHDTAIDFHHPLLVIASRLKLKAVTFDECPLVNAHKWQLCSCHISVQTNSTQNRLMFINASVWSSLGFRWVSELKYLRLNHFL